MDSIIPLKLVNPTNSDLYNVQLFDCLRSLRDTNIMNPNSVYFTDSGVARTFNYIKLSQTGQFGVAGANSNKIYITNDYGATWTLSTPTALFENSVAMSPSGKYIICCATRVFYSDDFGANFTEVYPTGVPTNAFWKAAVNDAGLIIIGQPINAGLVYYSTNGGTSFNNYTALASLTIRDWAFLSVSADSQVIYAIQANGTGGFVSTDGGVSFTQVLPSVNYAFLSTSYDGKYAIAGVKLDRVYISSNYGTTWTETQPIGNVINDWLSSTMSADGSYVIIADSTNNIYVSTNYGVNWDSYIISAALTTWSVAISGNKYIGLFNSPTNNLFSGRFPNLQSNLLKSTDINGNIVYGIEVTNENGSYDYAHWLNELISNPVLVEETWTSSSNLATAGINFRMKYINTAGKSKSVVLRRTRDKMQFIGNDYLLKEYYVIDKEFLLSLPIVKANSYINIEFKLENYERNEITTD